MLTRRFMVVAVAALLPAVAARRGIPALHYNYLTPMRLNVATIRDRTTIRAVRCTPDVSQLDPMPPVQALRNMATDRLQALGRQVRPYSLLSKASLIRTNNTITGNFAVELDIYTSPQVRAGFANASVTGSYTGDIDDVLVS